MSLFAYLAIALVVGALWGTALGFLLNAPRLNTAAWKQWAATAGTIVLVMACAVVMKQLGDLSALSVTVKSSAAAALLVGFGLAFWRCKVRL
jgi:hypothetical protein